MNNLRPDAIPREAVAAILLREVERRDDKDKEQGGGRQVVAHQLVAGGAFATYDGAQRRVYSILTGHYVDKQGRKKLQELVEFATVDKILTALDLSDLWNTELAAYVGSEDGYTYDPEWDEKHTCVECGHWIDFEGSSTAGVRSPKVWCFRCAVKLLPDPERKPDGAGRVRGIPWPEVRRLYLIYVSKGISIENVCAPDHARLGYKTPSSMARGMRQALRDLGLPVRTISETRRMLPRKPHERLPEEFLRKGHALHVRHDVSLNEICRKTHARFGFRTAKDMTGPLSRSWMALGLKARDRIEMTVVKSTTNGLSPRDWKERKRRRKQAGWGSGGGAGLNIKGHPLNPPCIEHGCGRPATTGILYCFAHNPDNETWRTEHLAAIRSMSPKQDPDRTEPVGQRVQPALQAYAPLHGARPEWKALAERCGLANETLRRMAWTVQPEQRTQIVTAIAILDALEEVA